MPGRLQDKVAIITGAGAGIGEAIAHKFAHEGASVLVADDNADHLRDVDDTLRRQGCRVASYAGDLADERHAQACVQAAVDKFGRLDILVNNAGVFLANAETQEYPVEAFDRQLRANVRSCFLMTRAALPHLRKTRGNIVSAGSESGELGIAQNTPYGATKGFVMAFMKGVAVEQAKHGVRANCVCPGPVDTAWTHADTGPMDEQMEQLVVASTLLGRRATVQEIANAYAFIASDEASYITGAMFFVDGGVTVAKGNVGLQVPEELRRPPAIDFELKHTRSGLAGKRTIEA